MYADKHQIGLFILVFLPVSTSGCSDICLANILYREYLTCPPPVSSPSPPWATKLPTALLGGRHEASTPMLPHLRHTSLSQRTGPKSAYSVFLSYFSQPHSHPISLHLSSLSSFSCLPPPPPPFNNSCLVTLHDLFSLMVL